LTERQRTDSVNSIEGREGLTRFERDVLSQAGVKYVVVGLGINDIVLPGSLTPATESISAESVIAGYHQLIARAHKEGIRVIGTTNPPFENSFLALAPATPAITFFTLEKESVRQKVNEWIRTSGEFDGVVDLDEVLRDPSHPERLLPNYDSGDHLHPNKCRLPRRGKCVSPPSVRRPLAMASELMSGRFGFSERAMVSSFAGDKADHAL
jgi:lysophospholipase L1-like esterase